jgi:hypothetical protein
MIMALAFFVGMSCGVLIGMFVLSVFIGVDKDG